MSTSILLPGLEAGRRRSLGWPERLARRAVLGRLARLASGELIVEEGPLRLSFGRPDPSFPVRTAIRVQDPRFWTRVAFGGTIGAGDAFADGDWSADDPVALVRLFVRNRAALEGLERGLARFSAPIARAAHRLRSNTRAGSRRNIAAHYDLGNDFYALFLDASMTYSALIFPSARSDLREAAEARNDLVCRKLALRPEHRLLEIGCGWGSLALHAASRYGCRVTAATISAPQAELARARVREAGLQDRVDVVVRDYRDLAGLYDRIASIEMIEGIGHAYLETFFRRCASLLAPGGLLLLQSITIAEPLYEAARRSVDFIQARVFPGCAIPSLGALRKAIERGAGGSILDAHDITRHYAETLRRWRERFLARRDEARALGFDERFLRLWEFYLAYCEGGFLEGAIGDWQLLIGRPGAVAPAPLRA